MYKTFALEKVILICIGMSFFLPPSVYAEGKPEVRLSNNSQLFLDNYIIARMDNLKRELQKPTKHPSNPLIVQDKPWEKRVIEIYGTVLYEPETEKFRCWYLASSDPEAKPEYYICYAESKDGINWIKPMVGQEKFGLYSQHNMVIHGGHGICVLKTPCDPEPGKRYKAAGGNIIANSPDGITWTMQKWESAGKNDTGTSLVWWKGEYLAFVRNQGKWTHGTMREVGLCISKNFSEWTKKKTIFKTDAEDGYPWTQPYGLSVTPYGDQLIGILWLIRLDRVDGNNSLGDMEVQLVVSRDGRKWNRVTERAIFLEPTPGSWDQGRLWPGTTMFVKDNRIYIYYSGTDTRHGSGNWGSPSIGLATLPEDRFMALCPDKSTRAGILETRPLLLSGKQLLVNADINGNSLQVELLNAKGGVIESFDRSRSRLIIHDELRYRVVWIDKSGYKSLQNAPQDIPLAIRFILGEGALYAFSVVD